MRIDEIFTEKELQLIDKVAEYLHIDGKIPEASRSAVIRLAVLDILIPIVINHMGMKYAGR